MWVSARECRVIRVCQMITELRPAGAERVLFELATRLDRSQFHVCVAALRGGPMVGMLRTAGVNVFVLGVRGKWDVLKLAGLQHWLHAQRIDVLHTHLFHADLAGRPAANLAGIRHIVHTVHVAEGRWKPWRYTYDRLCMRRGPIVCVSQGVADHHILHTGIGAARHVVIHNGIDAAAYARDDAKRQQLRRQWEIAQDEVVAVWAGRLNQQKGLDVLLAAVPLLAAQLGNHRLRLVLGGEGPWRDMLENFIRHQPSSSQVRVQYSGFVQDTAGLYSAGDLLVMPSRWEGFGLAAAEAMAAGLPVVATDIDGLREVVVADETGMLIPPENPAAFADVVGRLVKDADARIRLGQAGMQRVREHFTVQRMVREHEALYRQMMAD